jgi:hypothetical protein
MRSLIALSVLCGACMLLYPTGNAYATWPFGGDDNSSHCSGHSCNTTNFDDHSNNAYGGSAYADGGTGVGVGLAGAKAKSNSHSGVYGSGNSHVMNSPRFAQGQGQVGIVAPDIDTDVDVRNKNRNSNFGVNRQGQGQSQSGYNSQGQSQSGYNSQGQIGVNKAVGAGNITKLEQVYEAQERDPIHSAASVFSAACASGVSAQGVNLGGALAKTNEMCDLAMAIELADKLEDKTLRDELIVRAGSLAMHRSNFIRRFASWIPVVGSFF